MTEQEKKDVIEMLINTQCGYCPARHENCRFDANGDAYCERLTEKLEKEFVPFG